MSPQSVGILYRHHCHRVDETINAIAVVQGYASPSAVTTGVYEIGPITATPTFSPAAGSYGLAQTVTISDSTGGATIYYTTDGTTPTTGSIDILAHRLLSLPTKHWRPSLPPPATTIAWSQRRHIPSEARRQRPPSALYAGNYVGNQIGNHQRYIHQAQQSTTPTAGTNGSTPTTGSTLYSGSDYRFHVRDIGGDRCGQRLHQQRCRIGGLHHFGGNAHFQPCGWKLCWSPDGHHQRINLWHNHLLHHNDGTTPTTSSSVYTSPITVSSRRHWRPSLRAAANASSAVGSAAYTIAAAVPTFSPVAGNYRSSAMTVTISDTTPSSTIYYTTDGTTPTLGSAVNTPLRSLFPHTETLEAIATAPGDVHQRRGFGRIHHWRSGAYPLAPRAEAYTSIQTVTISDVTPSATIYYTTNGTTPDHRFDALHRPDCCIRANDGHCRCHRAGYTLSS